MFRRRQHIARPWSVGEYPSEGDAERGAYADPERGGYVDPGARAGGGYVDPGRGSYTDPGVPPGPVTGAGAPVAPAAAVPVGATPLVTRRRLGGGVTVASVGLLIVLYGAWGGIVPFVGPIFGYSHAGGPSWHWDLANALLFLVPGAVAVVMGFLAMAESGAVSHRLPSSVLSFSGLITGLCGAWFVIGPLAWPVLESGQRVFTSTSPLMDLAYWVGYSLGPGVILAMLGGITMGISSLSRRDARGLGISLGGPVAARQAA